MMEIAKPRQVAPTFLQDAEDYVESARQLAALQGGIVRKWVSPIYQLLCHAIELTLKAYLAALEESGSSESGRVPVAMEPQRHTPRKFHDGHCLPGKVLGIEDNERRLHRGHVRRECENVAGLLRGASRLRREDCLPNRPTRKVVGLHRPARKVEAKQLVEASRPQARRRLMCEHRVAGRLPLAAVVDAGELGGPVVQHLETEGLGGRIDARPCDVASRVAAAA
jgi:hypothetical protein